jgi:CHAT domain-containing protein
MMGLIRGALFAGAQSIIVSMWNIGDEITVPFMTHFYQLLKA